MPSKTRVLHFWCRFFEKICKARTRSPATREFAGTGTANDHAKMARRIEGERPKSPRRAGVLRPRRKARAHPRIETTAKSACPQNRFSRAHNWKPKIIVMPSKTRALHCWGRFFEKICPARTRSPATREFASTGTANDHTKMARRIEPTAKSRRPLAH